MADEIQRFIIQVQNREQIEALTRVIEQESDAVRRLNDDLISGVINQQQFDAAVRAHATTAVGAQRWIGQLTEESKNFSRGIMEATYAAQDFAQGGLGGILNNLPRLATEFGSTIPRIAALFGGPAGLAAAATGAGLAIWALKEPVTNLVTWMTSDGEGVPAAKAVVDRLSDSLGETKKKLKDLKEGWDWSKESVAEYNRLLGEQEGLEKKIAEERQRQRDLESARNQEAQAKLNPEAAQAAQKAITANGGVDKVIADLAPDLEAAARVEAEAQLREKRRQYQADLARLDPNDMNYERNSAAVNEYWSRVIKAAEQSVPQAVKEASARMATDVVTKARSGDMGAIDQLAGMRPGSGYTGATQFGLDSAKATQQAIENEQRHAAMVDRLQAAAQDRRDMAEADDLLATTARTPEQKAASERKRKAQDRAPRLARYAEEDRINATSTPEEIRQSAALEYLDQNIGRLAPGLKLDNQQQLAVSEAMMRNRDAKLDPETATEEALRDFVDPRRRIQREAQLHEIEGRINVDTGGALNQDQLEGVARQTQNLMQRGVDPMAAAQTAIGELLQGNAALMQRLQKFEAAFVQQAQQAAMMRNGMMGPAAGNFTGQWGMGY